VENRDRWGHGEHLHGRRQRNVPGARRSDDLREHRAVRDPRDGGPSQAVGTGTDVHDLRECSAGASNRNTGEHDGAGGILRPNVTGVRA
jgi:hypothetical protein